MADSVPGPDMIHPETLTEGIPDAAAVQRYTGVLARLAIPYAVDSQRRAVAVTVRGDHADPGQRLDFDRP